MRNIQEANKTVRSLQRRHVSCYTDATHASLSSGASQGAYIILTYGENGKIAPISWQSKKLCRVTKSPLASETLALSEGADAGFLVASVVQEIHALPKMPPILCYTDNHSLMETLHTTKILQDMRLRVDIARLREMIKEKEVNVEWIERRQQIADALTKRGASAVGLIGVLEASAPN